MTGAASDLVIAWSPEPGLSVTVGGGWLSQHYGAIQAAPVVTYQKRGVVPMVITLVLAPVATGGAVDADGLLRWARALA